MECRSWKNASTLVRAVAKNNHRRSRHTRNLARKHGRRPPYDRVLIVCEGEKTEPLYLEDIRISNRVPSAHVRVLHSEYGTQPRQVVDFAEEIFRETKEYDWVFAVFDRDDHLTYHDALTRAQALDMTLRNDERKSVHFVAVPSVPCFEFWLLLHFADIQAFFQRTEIVRRLKNHMPDYEKGATGVYAKTEPRLPEATDRAMRLRERFNPFSGTDPYTNVDELVTKLRSIRPVR